MAACSDVTTAEVEAVASFYTMCACVRPASTSCPYARTCRAALRGAKEVYDAAHEAAGIPHGEELSQDELITLHEEECLGRVRLRARGVRSTSSNHDDVTPERMRELIAQLRAGEVPTPVARASRWKTSAHASRLLAGLATPEEVEA